MSKSVKLRSKNHKIKLIGLYHLGERAIQIFAIFARRHWLKVTSQRAIFPSIARCYSDSGIV